MTEERTEQSSAPRLNTQPAIPGSHEPPDEPQRQVGAKIPRPGNTSRATPASPERALMLERLPVLNDDADVGIEKDHIVTRDGKADLAFTGVLLASAAPAAAHKGQWQELRIYKTRHDKYVFLKVTRYVHLEEQDAYEAEVFDPTPSTVPSQMIRTAREIARARPLTWMDAALAFFGYDPLAKDLYRKLSVRFEEQIS